MIGIREKKFFKISSIVIIVIIIFFVFIAYKKLKFGNNESNKSAEEVKEYILNIESYKATIEVTINSNKTSNKYLLQQEYSKDGTNKQRVIEPENIAGIEIEYKDNSLIINNSRFNLSKICSNYPYISNNVLWLNSFADFCKANSDSIRTFEENNNVVIEVDSNNNKYLMKRKLYLENGTGKPIKMEIKDDNKNTIIYILYKEVTINK